MPSSDSSGSHPCPTNRPSCATRRSSLGLALALAFVTAGGAVAIWSQPRITPNDAPVAPLRKLRLVGRVWTRLPGVDVAHVTAQLIKRDQNDPPGPLLGIICAETDTSGRFELVGAVPATVEGEAEVYLRSPPADIQWTYRPARVMLRPGRTVEGVEIELIAGVEVTGQFVDAESGEPVTPVQAIVIGPGRTRYLGPIVPKRTTDERGHFRFRLIPGEAELLAPMLPLGYAKAYPRVPAEGRDPVRGFFVHAAALAAPVG